MLEPRYLEPGYLELECAGLKPLRVFYAFDPATFIDSSTIYSYDAVLLGSIPEYPFMTIVRFTRQRQAVLETVQASRQHPDAARIFEAVRQLVPNISLGTVYRSLEALVEDGHLIQIQQPGAPTRYDARLERHYHLLCDSCGAVFDVELELPDLVQVARQTVRGASGQGFDVRAATVEFHGTCGRCQKN